MKRVITVLALALVMAAIMVAMAMPAFAKITPAQPPSCENNGGQQPRGQQPTCTGGGLTQNEATPATNPAGHAPPGQNA
jgi:hypothetical protein